MRAPIKVLHFYKDALPNSVGGIEIAIDSLCRTTGALGVANTVLVPGAEPSVIPMDNYTVVQVKESFRAASTAFSLEAFAAFRKLAREADIVHLHFPNPFGDVLYFASGVKKPMLVTYYSDIVRQRLLMPLYKPVMSRMLRAADAIIAISPPYAETSPVLQAYADKVRVIPIGLAAEALRAPDGERIQHWRARFPAPFFLFTGVMRYYKGLSFLLAAMQNAPHQLVLVGEGEQTAALKAQARRLRLDNVHFVGRVSEADKAALLHLCYAFVFPSHLRSEAYGMSLIEAAICGKPMISCEIGTGTSYINKHLYTGLVIEPASPVAIRAAMDELATHTDKTTTFGNNATKHYEKHFTAQKYAAAHLQLYEEMMG